MGTRSPAGLRRSSPGRPFPHARFRIAAVLAILTTLASLAMIRDEAPVVASGSISTVSGSPVPGATVDLLADGRTEARSVTDAGGRWWLSGGHRIDHHLLRVRAAGYMPFDGGLPAEARIVVHAYPTLTGRVVDDVGQPVAGASIRVARAHDPTVALRVAGADGGFDLRESLGPGQFSISVAAADHDPFHSLVHLEADQVRRFQAILVRQLGSVSISSQPPGLTPLVDGRALPSCLTPCTANLLVGHHELTFDTPLYVPWTQGLDIRNRTQTSASAILERKQGTLEVTTTGGALVIDGNPVGGSRWSGRLPTGTHLISNSSEGAWPISRSAEVAWNQTTTLNLAAIETAIVPGDKAGFLAGMTAYLKSVGGEYGVYLKDLKGGLELGYNEDAVMEAASDIKVPLALTLLSQVEAGKMSLADKVTLQDSDFMSGTGTLDGTAASGDQYSVQDLLSLMITISDNTAWQALMRVLTPAVVDAYAAAAGAPDCHQVDDNCTARELGRLFEGIYSGKLLKPAETNYLLDLLSNTIYNERIPYYLPGVRVAHKTGADDGVMNDAGIVYLADRPFLVAVFSVTQDGQTGIQATRDITRAFAHFLSR